MKNTCTINECNGFVVGSNLCQKHYMRVWRNGTTDTVRFVPLDVRFWRYVDKSGDCWIWTGAKSKQYGNFVISQRPTRKILAHRFSYELTRGPIPEGLVIDHLCRNPPCVNPDHLEIVTREENDLRRRLTHCKRNHEFTPENTYWPPSGGSRQCKQCKALRAKQHP